jgi:hypothetical protein
MAISSALEKIRDDRRRFPVQRPSDPAGPLTPVSEISKGCAKGNRFML